MAVGHRSDIGRFAILPLWILESDISATAIRLFAIILAKYADRDTNQAHPSRRTLATDIKAKSTNTIDRAIAELKAIGAVSVSGRIDDKGDAASNLYTLHLVRGRVARSAGRPVSPQEEGPVSPQNDHEPESVEPESTEPEIPTSPQPGKVYAGGHIRSSKPSPNKRHKDHVYCGDFFCVDAEKHRRFERRVVGAGGNLAEYDLPAWYGARDKELVDGDEQTTDHPLLWLEKQFAQSLRDSMAS